MKPMHKHVFRLVASTLSVALVVTLLVASKVALATGVNHATSVTSGDQQLQLNGAGVRRKDNANLYSAGLYLSTPARTPDAVLGSQGVKQLRVHMLQAISSRDMAQLLSGGLTNNNSDDDLATMATDMLALGAFIADRGKLEAGDGFQIDWHPVTGTTITVFQRSESKPVRQTFEKQDLMVAMLRIWIGSKPADPALKAALLGQHT